MGTKTRLPRSLFNAVLGLGLLSLVFLGSPGCGCGDDDLRPPGDERPPRCCCDFEWLPPRIANNDDVVLTIENADIALDAVATPTSFTNVDFRVPETFTVCVNQEHLLGNQLELVFRDQVTNEEYSRAMLSYKTRCRPEIQPLSDITNLISTDCGGDEPLQCCCEFEWRPGPNMSGDVTIAAENVSAGLNPVITPSAINGVGPDSIEFIEVCVDVDHPIGAQMDLVIRQAGSGALMGLAQLLYDQRCEPTIVPTTAFPALDITSTECGGEPLQCCCEFEWLPPVDFAGDVNLSVANVSPGLTVLITPGSITGVLPRQTYTFDVCINADHNLLDAFDLVITDTTGPEVGRARIIYRLRCEPDIGDVPGAGTLFLTTTDCGGPPLLCCCEIEWLLGDPDFNPPGSPWTAALENVDPTLEPTTLDPTLITFTAGNAPTFVLFTICVNPAHTPGAALELVVRDPTGAEIGRLPMDYVEPCIPFAGDPSGAGIWNILCQNGIVDKPGR